MSRCARCAAEFTCAMAEQTGQPCWCAKLPPQAAPVFPELRSDQASCFCPVCLHDWNDQISKQLGPSFSDNDNVIHPDHLNGINSAR